MILAYCPALDFNPKETQVTYEQILEIMKDNTRTDYQKAADLHAVLTSQPVAKPPAAKARKPRQPKAKAEPLMLTSGDDHAS